MSMIVVCQNCSARLQINQTKSPARPFVVRCPKCNSSINVDLTNPASEKSALAVGGSPATEHPRFEQTAPAPAFELEPSTVEERVNPPEDMVRMLASLLRQTNKNVDEKFKSGTPWIRRKALVCVAEGNREVVARRLAETGCQVFVAEDTGQAVQRMRENQLDVVLLDPEFDPMEQGAAFVTREVNVLRPAQRRRLFFVLLTPSQRTMDVHAAFLQNVNAIINFNDIGELSRILEHSLREYNELYKGFNMALNMPGL